MILRPFRAWARTSGALRPCTVGSGSAISGQQGDSALLAAQRSSQVQPPPQEKTREYSRGEEVSPQIERRIFLKMQEIRQKIAVKEGSKPYLIASNSLLKTIAKNAPTSQASLERIGGFRQSGLCGAS